MMLPVCAKTHCGVGRVVSRWEVLNYWDFMTPDMFFTTVLINALPEGETRTQVILETATYLARRTHEREERGTGVVDPKDISTYHYVSEYMELVKTSPAKKAVGAAGGATSAAGAPRSMLWKFKKQQDGTEMAAVAAEGSGGGVKI